LVFASLSIFFRSFYTTAVGREHFSNQIQSIRYW
jgi:hypothetical protein